MTRVTAAAQTIVRCPDLLMRGVLGLCLIAAPICTASAQSPAPGGMPPPPGMSLAQSTAMRFPQPVRAGDLPGRDVLQPVESQNILGHVRRLVRDADGQIMVVIDYGGVLGIGGRLIAVPADAIVLLGADVEIVAYTPKQLRRFPTFSAAGTTDIADDTILRLGLAKPSH